MMKRMISLALIAVLMAMFIPALAAAEDRIMYVYTDNGKSLNVRSAPNTGDNIIGSLKYGEQVDVISISNGWANIWWGQSYYGEFGTAYVQSRFLLNYKPAPHAVQPTAAPASGAASGTASDNTDYTKAFSSMNAEFKSAKKVAAPYTVVARPSRASGWVNLRWAPSLEAERIATCPQGKALTVIGETKNWYQVRDPETGMIGFISKQYVSTR